MGLDQGSYEAYCLDEAVSYFGMVLEGELERAGQKPSKEERQAEAARTRLLERWLGEGEEVKKQAGFADPALMFK